ncbi:MAG: tetratricopeptide repeat protein [Planctomycetes bacterium]|nr:tetratricopeptide repeat protein [Planctomycetota bacterium]
MDGPLTLGRSERCLGRFALYLLTGLGCLAGCTKEGTLPVAESPVPSQVAVEPEKDQPQQQPKASTCVSFADFQAHAALEPENTASAREQKEDQARLAYQQALRLDPHSVAAYTGLGRLYQAMGDHERALATFQKGLQACPKEAGLWFELGMCQAQAKSWPEAAQSLQTAVKLDPENRGYVKTLGFCLARAGQYDASVACLRNIMSEPEARYNVARMQHHNHEDPLCRENLEAALKVNPDYAPARQLLAELDSSTAAGVPNPPSAYSPITQVRYEVNAPPSPGGGQGSPTSKPNPATSPPPPSLDLLDSLIKK